MSKPNFDFEAKQDTGYKTLVENLLIDPKKYNLRFRMPSIDQIQLMVKDLELRGQIQPIVCVPLDGKMTVVIGFCRALAFKEWNRQQRVNGIDETPIRFVTGDKKKFMDELYRAENNIAENEVRFEPTPMDKAYAMRKLHDDFKMDQTQIAEKYGISQASVSNYLRLFTLSETIQNDIHDKTITMSQALLLFKVPEQKRDQVVKEAKANPSGSSKLDNVPTGSGKDEGKARVNTGSLKDAAQKVAKTTYNKSITDFKNLCMLEDCETPRLNLTAIKVLNGLMDWFTGTKDDEKLVKILNDNTLE